MNSVKEKISSLVNLISENKEEGVQALDEAGAELQRFVPCHHVSAKPTNEESVE
jgi:hypothetical protein